MKFNVNMTIVKPNVKEPQKEVNLEIGFYCDPNDYGNGYRAWIDHKDIGYEEGFDLRYDIDFDERFAELWITNWIYHNWSGEQDSYDVQELTIERIEE